MKVRRCARKLFGGARAARALCSGGGAASVWEAAGQQLGSFLRKLAIET